MFLLKNSNLSSINFTPDEPKIPIDVTAARSNRILDQLSHSMAQGIYIVDGVSDLAVEQAYLIRIHTKYCKYSKYIP